MQRAIERGEFLETATFSGNMYGTRYASVPMAENTDQNCRFHPHFNKCDFSKQSVRTVQHLGKVCVLDIEIEGVKQIRNSDLNPILVFINPPSMEELERRLRGRKTETEESLQKRLNTAKIEIEYGILHKCNSELIETNSNSMSILWTNLFRRYYAWQFRCSHPKLQFKVGLQTVA